MLRWMCHNTRNGRIKMFIYKKRLVYHQLRKDDLKPIKVVWTCTKKVTWIRIVVMLWLVVMWKGGEGDQTKKDFIGSCWGRSRCK